MKFSAASCSPPSQPFLFLNAIFFGFVKLQIPSPVLKARLKIDQTQRMSSSNSTPNIDDMCDDPAEIEGWLRQQVLGSGAFGVVTLWKHRDTGQKIAIKKCRWVDDPMLTPKHKERWTKEVEIMQRLQHPGVVKTLPVPPEMDRELRVELPLLCMEFCSKGDLRQVLNMAENCCGLSEAEIRSIVKDITSAVEYLHANKITHRDLKPDNIVLQEAENSRIIYKLIDLGYAKELDQSSMAASFVGTLQYLAPELFLSNKYSCTVDYWSLGLLTHEIITGVRPFLPQMSPAAWMKHVQKKAVDDICAFQTDDGGIVFSKQLFPENHISSTFQYHIEKWLRILLDWDPKRRGRLSADSDLMVFSMLNSILSKKIVPVFCVPMNCILSYEVDETTELATLQQWIARDTGLGVKDQELLFPRGTSPDPSMSADQCCLPLHDGTPWYLFVLQKDIFELPQVKPHIPTLVGQMVSDTKSVFEYQYQKRSWAQAVFFLQQEANLYCNFLRSHRAKMLSVLSKTCELGKLVQRVQQERQRTNSFKDLFITSLEFDVSKIADMKSNHLKDLCGVWNDTKSQLLRKIKMIEERVAKLETDAEAIGSIALQLQRSPFARIRISSNLDNLAEAGQNCYEALRRRNKEQRKVPQNNSEMARVVYNCLKHRDKLLHDQPFSDHLKQLMECQAGTDKVTKPMENCLLEISRLQEDITRAQIQRQEDLWLSAINGQVPPLVPSRGAIPKQLDIAKKGVALESESDTQTQSQIQGSLDLADNASSLMSQSTEVIKENQELRYMTQELMNKGYGLYKNILGLDFDERILRFAGVMPAKKRGNSFRVAESTTIKKRARTVSKLDPLQKPLEQREAGQIFTLGENLTGQLGLDSDEIDSKKRPAIVAGLSEAVAVSCGGMHTICLLKNGDVITFGCNDDGALGHKTGDDDPEFKPAKVELPGKAIQVTAGDSHSAALLEDGRVFAWGSFRDSSGVFGLTMTGNLKEETPVEMLTGNEIIKISSGDDHLVMLSSAGIVYTIGNGEQGQLGRVSERTASNKSSRHHKVQLLTPLPVDLHAHRRASSKIKCSNVWTGSWTTICQSDSDAKIYVFGLNNYYQIGLEEINNPQYLPALSERLSTKKWKKIAGGQHHTLCLDEEGVVYSFGRQDYGRLGLGQQNEPVREITPIPALQGIKCIDVACGNVSSFAVTEEGKVYSWGMGGTHLGIGGDEPVDVLEPQLMQGKALEKKAVISIGSGGQHTALVAREVPEIPA
ncbi:Hypothetical predicted protein [Cloeon dipterum]|uniref:IkappaB kinase n=1 Tax=Cloeon dipterum TaxID=197152 RepID=A0A8S1C5C3_9INSE|nr:Hypothetical predicted protein [Cloeon dipterum]